MAAAVFPFDPRALPSVRTRKALLVLDLQNDFISADGALPVPSPVGFVDRVIDVARAFRETGAGDVIWVRSLFEGHRRVTNEQILISDIPLLPTTSSTRTTPARRGRRRPSDPPDTTPPDADAEAFLTLGSSSASGRQKPLCVRPDTPGIELALDVAAAIDRKRDLVLTKTHYSAFESNQLLMRLRTRFATELYICGALTNISIYATALDAGRHGLATTIIDDCCGYRSQMRHFNALRQLAQLAGCETASSAEVIAAISPRSAAKLPAQRTASPAATSEPVILPVRSRSQSQQSTRSQATADNLPRESSEANTTSAPEGSKQPPVTAQPPLGTGTDATPANISIIDASRQAGGSPPATEEGPASDDSPLTTSALVGASRNAPKPNAADIRRIFSDIADAASSRVRRTSAYVSAEATLTKPTYQQESPPSSAASRGKAVAGFATGPPILPTGTNMDESRRKKNAAGLDVAGDEGSDVQRAAAGNSTADSALSPTPTEPLCEGDTAVFHNVLPPLVEQGVFARLKDEVSWLRMSHQGGEVPRLVCVQGEIREDGAMPVYRHPADESPPLVPFTPTVVEIKTEVEKILGHPLNHVLIQFYRDGNDYISEHSDKSLDIVKGSFICNVSLGAERTMVFRTKRLDKDPSRKAAAPQHGGTPAPDLSSTPTPEDSKRQTTRARLPHNSLCRMGLLTNMRWLHAIRQDKRAKSEKTSAELAFDGGRISLTFRQIGTYLDRDSAIIWGQGATSKTRDDARSVINGQSPEAVRMLQAFGTENHSSEFDWDKHYGGGFDVLHMSNSPRLFSSSDKLVNLRIQLLLSEYGIGYAKGSMVSAGPSPDGEPGADAPETVAVKFVDNDEARSTMLGELPILLYVDEVYGKAGTSTDVAKEKARFSEGLALSEKWRALLRTASKESSQAGNDGLVYLRPLQDDLKAWDSYALEAADRNFVGGGGQVSIADFAFWPVLYEMRQSSSIDKDAFLSKLDTLGLEGLRLYYDAFGRRPCVQRVLKSSPDDVV